MKSNDLKKSEELSKLFSEETLSSMEMARVYGGGYEDELEDDVDAVAKESTCPKPSTRFPNCTIKGNAICK